MSLEYDSDVEQNEIESVDQHHNNSEYTQDSFASTLKEFKNEKTNDEFIIPNHEINETELNKWKNLIKDLTCKEELTEYVKNSKKKFNTLIKLQNYIKSSPANSETETLWIIFMWIANKIEFDISNVNLYNVNYTDAIIEKFLKKGKCSGDVFCILFKKLCDYNNIKCMIINGFCKGYGYKVGKKFREENHEWIAVFLKNKWRLIDVSWASGYLNDKEEFIREFQPYYFFTPPEIFIYQHYSENHQYQENKITLKQFIRMPLLRLEYFLNDIKVLNDNMLIKMDKNPFLVNFQAPAHVKLIANLYERNEGIIENSVFTQRNYITNNYEVNIQIPHINWYYLKVYAGLKTDENLKWVGDFSIKLNIAGDILNFFSWSQVYSLPRNVEAYLINPTNLLMMTNEVVCYKIYVPNAYNVGLIDEFGNLTNLIKVKDEKDIWYIEYENKAKGELKLSAKFEKNGSYYTAYSFIFI